MEEVWVDLRLKVALTSNGFRRRRTNLAGRRRQVKCNALSSDIAHKHVTLFFETEFHDGLGELRHKDYNYMIFINKDGLISKYSCNYMSASLLVYKHIHMTAKMFGQTICFQTREPDSSQQADVSMLMIQTSDENNQKEEVKASIGKILTIVEPILEIFNNLSESKLEV